MLTGKFKFVHSRNGKVIDVLEGRNIVVDEGANRMLDTMFGTVAKSNDWYVGLIESGTLSTSDTLASHPGWVESAIATRIQWVASASAGSRKIDGSAHFSITASGTVIGAFFCDASTGTTGTLHSEKLFDSAISLVNGDTLDVYYTAEEQ